MYVQQLLAGEVKAHIMKLWKLREMINDKNFYNNFDNELENSRLSIIRLKIN